MSRLKDRSQFYQTLAALEGAGVPRTRALEQRHRGPFRQAGLQMARLIDQQGMSLTEAMGTLPRLFAPFERSMVEVGEATGRLDTIFTSLAGWFELLQRLRTQVISGLLYPAIQYHAAAVLIPAIGFITGTSTLAQAGVKVALLLGIPYLICFFVFAVWPRIRRCDSGAPPAVGRVLCRLPVIGTFVRKLNYTRFFHAFAVSLQAGTGVADAVRLAATGCTNSFLRQRLLAVAAMIEEDGCPFTVAFRAHLGDQSSVAAVLMETGEVSGSSDEMAGRIARVYSEETEEALRRVAQILPVVVYLAIAAYIGLHVIRFYHGYVEQLKPLL